MTLLFTGGECSLISHEIYLNQIYQNASHSNDAAKQTYKIRSEIFDLNVPYRPPVSANELRLKEKQRKIKAKNAENIIKEHPDEHALVK